jgi:competence protein ComEC
MNKKIKRKLVFCVIIASCFLACGLLVPAERAHGISVQFGVFNVGQGLSQIVKADTSAIVFDMGPAEGFGSWRKKLATLGKTHISDIVISHDHKDHWGGLQMLETSVLWNGCLITSPGVDTGALRDSFPLWKDRLYFKTMAAGDTLVLPCGVIVSCVWPPAQGLGFDSADNFANNSSLVFLIKRGETTVLITSDIDSNATRQLCSQESIRLKADIMVVPHHGSGGSLDPVFYGYAKPAISIISYGRGNSYGHPSPSVLLWLSQTGTEVLETAIDGNCFFESNGYYWMQIE